MLCLYPEVEFSMIRKTDAPRMAVLFDARGGLDFHVYHVGYVE